MILKSLPHINIHQAKGMGYINCDWDAMVVEFLPNCLHYRDEGNGESILHPNWMPKDAEVLHIVDALYNLSPSFRIMLNKWFEKKMEEVKDHGTR